jgi:hypothetical protein
MEEKNVAKGMIPIEPGIKIAAQVTPEPAKEVDFGGVMIADHTPLMDDDRRVGTAYSLGYMQALVERANAEAGGDG